MTKKKNQVQGDEKNVLFTPNKDLTKGKTSIQ